MSLFESVVLFAVFKIVFHFSLPWTVSINNKTRFAFSASLSSLDKPSCASINALYISSLAYAGLASVILLFSMAEVACVALQIPIFMAS
ncbi:hypothetical protein FEE95_14235 [Maribacter algarum]|uniref:Uncharacterized protein n=1 Tax=Maribacter algarum (ex Zhang et al. 2020) TaxID=2578118 RepID=A0A5S3PPD9_9FLAO|nr:hypothetical protein FEE95_14235 [Maribacter algarum]